MKKAILAAFFLFLPLGLFAQTVAVTTSGNISISGQPIIYTDKWVIQKTDFGFLWLDSVNLVGGLVQVQAKCGVGQPPSNTNLYVLGDCNGITSVAADASVVQAYQYSGQCGACTQGCGGPRDDGHFNFVFTLGTWAFTGQDQPDITPSTATHDLSNRTWAAVAISPFDGKHFEFHVTGGSLTPTDTPTITPTFTPTWTPGGPTATPTNTPTITPTRTPVFTATNTPSPTITPFGGFVACVSLLPNTPVPRGTTIYATNCSWWSPSITLNFVDYGYVPGTCGSELVTGQMPPPFNQQQGIAVLTAPSAPGFYCLFLKYHYTPRSGSPTTTVLNTPFVVN